MQDETHSNPEPVSAAPAGSAAYAWKQKWAEMNPMEQLELWERVAVTPFKVVLRPWWHRIAISPIVWSKHYRISRQRNMSVLWSCRWAFVWTGLLLFPKWFVGKSQ